MDKYPERKMKMEDALERRIKYYEDDARRYEEQADEVASRGFPTMAEHFRAEASRFRGLCQQLREDTPADS